MKPKKPTIMCLECGVKPCKRGAKKYCSLECSLKNTAVQKQEYDKYEMYKNRSVWNRGMKGIHLSPDTEFKKGHQMNLGRERPDRKGENNNKWVEKIERSCSYCRKELSLTPYQVKNRTRNFCNRECWALGTRGLGSPVYKGEEAVSRLRNRIAQMPEYRAWHAEIMKRDGYQCVLCGAKESKETPLEVDHIKRFLHIAQENAINTPEDARNCVELWDVANGRTICRPCHRALDTYGTKGLRKNLST